MKSIAQIRAEDTKTADLIAFFNDNCPEGKEVKKFSDRATAVKRCVELAKLMALPEYTAEELATLNPEAQAAVHAAEEAAKKEAQAADERARNVFGALFGGMSAEAKAAHENGNGKGTKVQDGKPVSEEEDKKAPVHTGRASNSAGVAASWANPDVMAARLTRHGVAVTVGDDVREFKSTRDAFRALRLPDSKHIRFRMALKAEGNKVFELNGKEYHFELREISKPEEVPAEEKK